MMFPAERAARAATLTAGLGMRVGLAKEQGRRSKAASAAEFTTPPRLAQVIAVVDFPVLPSAVPPPMALSELHDRLRFVLVRTSHSGNIGSAARAVRPVGLDRLAPAAPPPVPPT